MWNQNRLKNKSNPDAPQFYEIRVAGELDDGWAGWFEGLSITRTGAGQTILAGWVSDQSALHAFLARIRDLNLSLLSVQRLEQGPVE